MKPFIAIIIFLMSAPLNAHDYHDDDLQYQLHRDRRQEAEYQRNMKPEQWRQNYERNRIRRNQMLMHPERWIPLIDR
jgi:hypothetical protein